MPEIELPRTNREQAKRVLFALGLEAPSARLIDYAERTRAPFDADADARIKRAMALIEDGPIALVAENGPLGDVTVPPDLPTIRKAAHAVVYALGRRLIDAPEPPPVTLTSP
jgi:hypothetical protein